MGSLETPRSHMEVIFYRFNKAKNETKIPNEGDSIDVFLKEQCSVLNPVLVLNINPSDYNYFYIPQFMRYYFISDCTYIGNETFSVSGQVDVMASYRNEILASSQYIQRAATGYDSTIPDVMYPAKGGRHELYAGIPLVDVVRDYKQGTYILGVIGSSPGYAGVPVTYYALGYDEMRKFNAYLFNTDNYGTMITDDVIKAFFNPMDYIISCIYIPYQIDFTRWTSTDIDFGWFKTSDISAYIVEPYYFVPTDLNHDFTIPKPHGDYRDLSPWTQYRIWIGNSYYDLPPEKLYNYQTLRVSPEIDMVTGVMNVAVNGVNGEQSDNILRCSFQYGCPIALAQIRTDVAGMATGIAGAAGNIASLNIGKAVNSVMSAIESAIPDPAVKGSNGGLGSAYWNVYVELYTWYYDTVPLDASRVGRPVCKEDTISNYTGYCLCRSAEIELDGAYADEIDSVTSYMNGGFYVN